MRRRGASLVEVIVAVTLLALVGVVVLNLLPTSALAVRQAEHRIAAVQLCQSLLAEAALGPYDALALGEQVLPPVTLDDQVVLKPVRRVMAVTGPHAEDPAHVRRVRIEVRWTEARNTRTQEVWQEQWVSRVRR